MSSAKNAGTASVEFFKRRRSEIQGNQDRLQFQDHVYNDEPSETDTDSEARWFWNESANESQSDSEEEGDCDSEEEKTEREKIVEEPKTVQAATAPKLEWKPGGRKYLRGGYGNGSKANPLQKKRCSHRA